MAFGERSAEMTTCRPLECSVSNVVEELFLGALLAGNELNIVNQQDIDAAVAVPEFPACDCGG